MGKTVQMDLNLVGEVPQEVKERVRANLKGRAIDCSEIPDLTEWLEPPVIVKVSFDSETAKSLRDAAMSKHQTPAQAVSEIVRANLRMAQ